MQRPPRDPHQPLFGARTFALSLLQGTVLLLVTLAVLGLALSRGAAEGEARAMAFLTLVAGNLGLILTNRSWRQTAAQWLRTRNPALWWITGGACAFLALALTLPFLRTVFHFQPITASAAAACFTAGLASALWFELMKPIPRY